MWKFNQHKVLNLYQSSQFSVTNIHVNRKALYNRNIELNGEYKKIPKFKFFIFLKVKFN